ncbi:MAG TPA: hypothetical protein DDZ80_00250, partial [Cyanobacteria bacterium UBA8803]|nr:hypothetical protein [Cyanobacteria bacterium UBA8803]
SILVGQEYAVPYHWGYYREFRQRTLALINAQYSPDPAVVRDFIQKYSIDFWLLSATAFTPESVANNRWIMQYQPAATEAVTQLQAGKQPALVSVLKGCTVWENQGLIVLSAECVLKIREPGTVP